MKAFIPPIVALTLVPTAVWAEEFDADGDPIPRPEGPIFFGFVKDTKGTSVAGAKVTLAPKIRDAVTTYTNSVGAYRVTLGKDVDANAVVVSCEKAGFKQVRVLRHTAPNALIHTPIEIECTLEQ